MSNALDWFLSDPALILPKPQRPARLVDKCVGKRVRYRSDSEQAVAMHIPVEMVGVIRGVGQDEGEWRANVNFGPAGFVFGARLAEFFSVPVDQSKATQRHEAIAWQVDQPDRNRSRECG